MPEITIHRKAHFNAAHRLFCPDWSEKKNIAVFGKCANPKYHGHNYELIVSITGEVQEKTGFVINLDELKNYIYEDIEEYMDHKNLNEEVPEFKTLNPTVENITIVIWNRLKKRLSESLSLEVTVYETPRNFATYKG